MKPISFAAALLLAANLAFAADVTVNGMIAAVQAALEQKETDKQVAKAVSKMKLTERLSRTVLDELENQGAGPETMTELDRQADETVRLPKPEAPSPFPQPPQPTLEEMQDAIKAAREYALHYAHSLPDFLCTENVKRYQDMGVHGSWMVKDTLTVHLGYLGQHEEYKLVAVNGRPTSNSYESVGGAISQGEFGSMMYEVFYPASHARIFWDHWARVRHHAVQVYSYVIKVQDSTYKLGFTGGRQGQWLSTIAGSAGLIYIDPESHAVVRLTRSATEMSSSFPITQATTVLDYDYGEVGGRQFFLPMHAQVRMDTRDLRTRNEVDFSEYRKFAGESTISFGDPAAPPAPPIKH